MTADACELVSKGDVDSTEGVLNDLGHLGWTDVGNNDLTLAERSIVLLNLLANLLRVGTDGTVVVEELINHIARDDTLRSVNEVEVFSNLETVLLDYRTDEVVHSARADGWLNDNGCALWAHLHHLLDSSYYIACVNLLWELVVWGRNGHDIHVGLLILGSELDASLNCIVEEFIETILLEGGATSIESVNKFLIVVGTNNFNTMWGHHQGCWETDVA